MMKTKMSFWSLIVLLAFSVGLGAGCVSFEPGKFENQVHHWVPLGTTETQARHAMTRHGFDCELVKWDSRFNQSGFDYLDCSRTQVWFHDWNVQDLFQRGQGFKLWLCPRGIDPLTAMPTDKKGPILAVSSEIALKQQAAFRNSIILLYDYDIFSRPQFPF